MVSLVGKIVKCSDIGLLSFFYPDFLVVSELAPGMDRVIFVGDNSQVPRICSEYIIVGSQYELDLDNRMVLLEFVFSRSKKRLTKAVREVAMGLSDVDFYRAIKYMWVVGEWCVEDMSIDVCIYNMFFSMLSGGFIEVCNNFYNLLSVYPYRVLESSVLRFFDRVIADDTEGLSNKYRLVVSGMRSRYGVESLRKAVLGYINLYGRVMDELRMLRLFLL